MLKRLTHGDRIFLVSIYIFLSFVLIAVAAPLIFVLVASVSDADAVLRGEVFFWPVGFHLDAYRQIFRHDTIMIGYRNTIFYTTAGTAINMVLTICAAYPLSRKDLKGRNVIMLFLVFTMFFSGGLIPFYLTVLNLGIQDSIWVMLLPAALSTFNVIILRTFFANAIPQELTEAAYIDGASNIKILFKVILPLSKAVLAVLILWYSVGHWNSFFNAFLFLRGSRELWPLQLILREVLIMGRPLALEGMTIYDLVAVAEAQRRATLLQYALIVVANAPLLMIYPFIQKYFAQGIMIGSVKG